MTADDLFNRGIETLVASWEVCARRSRGAAVERFPSATAAVFSVDPERRVYNNAIVDRDLVPAERREALAAIEAAYTAADVDRFAVWVHESDEAMQADLERRGYTLAECTRAMGMVLDDIRLPRPKTELAPADWDEHMRIIGAMPCLLAGIDRSAFRILNARLDGEGVATAIAFDHADDCGIYDVATLEHARKRGLATALVGLHLHDALVRGCHTASVQSTLMGEHVYAALGFSDLGRILEYVPAG